MAGAVPEACARREGRRRHHHCAGHRGRRSCWLDGQHAAHPDDRRCGRADSGARRWGLCRRARPGRCAWRLARKESCLGTRFLATVESPLHPNFKQAIVDSDGHDTQLSEIPDIAAGLVWPGAMTRSRRNRFIERWAGREWALRQGRAEAIARLRAARESGDVDEGPLSMGQDAGLIHDIPPAADIVTRIAREAEEILARTASTPRHRRELIQASPAFASPVRRRYRALHERRCYPPSLRRPPRRAPEPEPPMTPRWQTPALCLDRRGGGVRHHAGGGRRARQPGHPGGAARGASSAGRARRSRSRSASTSCSTAPSGRSPPR